MAKKSLQELADARLAPEYRQPLKTLADACKAIGWNPEDEPLLCCGEQTDIRSWLGTVDSVQCHKCNRFVFNVTAPEWGNGHMTMPSSDIYDFDTDKQWVSGQKVEGPA